MKKSILLILLIFLIQGCAYFGTVYNKVGDQQFQSENLPIRTLRLYVFSDDSYSKDTIRKTIHDASEEFKLQVGIELKIVKFQYHQWEGISITKWKNMIYDSLDFTKFENDKFDVAISISGFNPIGMFFWHGLGAGALGYTEDRWRRYIAIKKFDKYVLMHELSHCFIFSHVHSPNGLMAYPWLMLIKIPVLPITINSITWLSERDRKEILLNKWRDFSKIP